MKLLVLALVASLALNVYLIATRDSRLEPDLEILPPTPPPTSKLLAPSPSRAGSYSTIERAALEQRVLTAEAEVEKYMRAEDRYPKLARSFENEARVKPYLDMVFKDVDLPEPKYTFECHGFICKIDSDQRNANAWTGPLQRSPGREMFGAMSFSDKTFIELLPEDKAWTNRIWTSARRAAFGCITTYPIPEGELSVKLAAANGQVTPVMSGPLATEPVGKCVAIALRDAIATLKPPPDVQVDDEPRTFQIPLE